MKNAYSTLLSRPPAALALLLLLAALALLRPLEARAQATVSTLAGGGTNGTTAGSTDGTGTATLFYAPAGVAVDGAGNVYVADYYNHKIRKVTPARVVTTLAGGGANGTTVGSTDGTGTAALLNNPYSVAVDRDGNVYVADYLNNKIRKVTPAGAVTTLAGGGANGTTAGSTDGTGTAALFNRPDGVAVDGAGNVYVADLYNSSIRKVTPTGVVTTLAGGGANGTTAGSTDGTGTAALFSNPSGVTVDGAGNVYVADRANNKIRKVTPAGVVTTLAGGGANGTAAGSTDGTGTAALLDYPSSVAVDRAGNVYVADRDNHKIRKVTPAGVVTTLAGGGANGATAGSTDGMGTAALFNFPSGVAVDGAGNVYVGDFSNNRIRLVTLVAAPILTSLSPTSGPVGTSVTLTGINLTGATGVSFNGTAATTFVVVNSNTITATVPPGATSGNVTVTTPSGTTSGFLFTVTYPDLVVNTNTTIPAGIYNSITVTSTGVGTLAGDVTVNTSLTVQRGGTLSDGCALINGAGSFTLADGATLNICAAQGIAAGGASGAVQVTGARSFSSDASYVYNGNVVQVTGTALPAQVRNLTTINLNDVTLSQGVAIAQVLTIGNRGDLVQPSAAASVTLLSDATAGTALLVNRSSGVLLGPTTTIQRAIDGSTNAGSGYRHFAPPVYGATIGSLTTNGFTPVVNSLYNTQGTSVQPFPTVYFYDESRVSDTGVPGSGFDKGWVSPADLTDQLFNASGYTLQLPATAKLSVTGRVFDNGGTGRYVYRTGSDAAAGWGLVGNPYPSPIDWSLVAASDRAGLDAAMYVFESTGPYTGSYRSYANGIGGNPIIPMGQAFFVRVSSGQTQGLMFFQGSQRVTTFNPPTSFKRTTADSRPQLALSLSGATLHDITYLYQEAGATTGIDAEYDAVKMPNSNGLNVSQLASNAKLAINGLPILTATTSVPLVVGVPAAGTYTLAPTTLSNLPAGLDAYLRDAQTGQTVKLAVGSSYRFDVTATQASTPALGRFTLLFSPATPLATTSALAPELVGIYPNPAHGSFTVTVPPVAGATQVQAKLLNSLGQVVRQQSAALPASGASFRVSTTELAAGVYVLRLQAGDTTLTKRVVVQ